MRELTTCEVNEVSGGVGVLGGILLGAAVGTGVGMVIGTAAYLAYLYIQSQKK